MYTHSKPYKDGSNLERIQVQIEGSRLIGRNISRSMKEYTYY